MLRRNIVLVGFMGAGKTLVSKSLAQVLCRQRVSTDELIMFREGRLIREIFVNDGEAYFRRVEEGVVAQVAGWRNLIIDCGGGVVLNANNVSLLKSGGTFFYLKASPAVLYERLNGDEGRPLLQKSCSLENIAQLVAEREPLYAKAEHVIEVDGLMADEVVRAIVALLDED